MNTCFHEQVYFADYGNTERVHKTELRHITPELEKIPPQAFRCKLKGVANTTDLAKKFKDCSEGFAAIIKLGALTIFVLLFFHLSSDFPFR